MKRIGPLVVAIVNALSPLACTGPTDVDAGAARDAGADDAGALIDDGGHVDDGVNDSGVDDGGAHSDDGGVRDGGVDDAGPTAPLVCAPVGGGVVMGRLGAADDDVTTPMRRVILMGGGPEVDDASATFVSGANGGDVVVVRASGSVDSYTPYFYDELPAHPAPRSVTTLRLATPASSTDDGAQCIVNAAEALWIAGGDQSQYFAWSTTFLSALEDVHARGAAVGGTSAGAMVLGTPSFAATLGSVTSDEVLANPLRAELTLVSSTMAAPEFTDVIVDTHFSDRTREGRLLAFMAVALSDVTGEMRGVGLDEESAITVENGQFLVETGDPTSRVFVYRVVADVAASVTAPLSLTGVTRVTLIHGDTGAWPLDFTAFPTTTLVVENGVVVTQ